MNKIKTLLIIILMINLAYSADSLTVTGSLLNMDGNGVENAKIISEENVSAFTDINGEYTIKISKDFVPIDNSDIVLESYGNFRIKIFNILGQKIYDTEFNNAAFRNFIWRGNNLSGKQLSSGIYFPVLLINNKIVAKSKMTIVGQEIINNKPFVNFTTQMYYANTLGKLSKKAEDYIFKFDVIGDNFTNKYDLSVNVTDNDNDDLCDAEEILINTYQVDSVTDIDGNVYKTVKIGNQWWMAENLKVTHYRDGSEIPMVTDSSEWSQLRSLQKGAYCYYDNVDTNTNIYGNLYNWYVVSDSSNIAPEGWHVPSDSDWKEMEMYIGISESEVDSLGWRGTNEGTKLKSTTNWNNDGNGTDEFGFSAFPAGYRDTKKYGDLKWGTYFWSSSIYNDTHVLRWGLNCINSKIEREYRSMHYGFSVRCVKD